MIILQKKIPLYTCLFFILLLGSCKTENIQGSLENKGFDQWTLDSFQDFANGTFDDSGVNAYAAADGSLRLINQYDLTEDGYVDILLPNQHGQNERTEFFIYFGKDKWNPKKKLALPSDGGQAAAVADLNLDGRSDLVLINRFNGTKSELDLWIYWGSNDGLSPKNCTYLPTQGAEAVQIGDLNDDGHSDIVVANSGLSYHVSVDSYGKSFIYWNRKGIFSAKDRSELPTIHARDVVLTDLDKNGHLDIVFANQGNEDGEGGLRIFKNSGDETFRTENMIILPGEKTSAVAAADLSQNGWTDLVVANAFRLGGREGGIYDIVETTHLNSFIYWGGEEGFAPEKRTELPTVNPRDISIGDLDQNGWSDIFFAQSGGGTSFLYEGGADGFFPNKRKAIPGLHDGSSEIVDLNADGWNDLIVAPAESPDSTTSMLKIYWGGSKGLLSDNPHLIPVGNTGGITVADLDEDATNDLIVVNRSNGPDASRSPAYLYSGDANGFSAERRTEIPTNGDDSYLAVDLDANGYVDLFIPQHPPTIFWGGSNGFNTNNSRTLTNQYAFSGRAADFNHDGFLDLVVSEWSPGLEETHIYYGGPSGFTKDHRQKFPIRSVRFHTIADMNNDGWIDVLFPNFLDEQVVIFWNGPLGFDPKNKAELPTRSAVAVEVADLNRDGFLDVIVPNLFDKNPAPGKTRSFGGSAESDTFIFWGGPDGSEADNPTILPTVGAEDAAVADLNKNGYLDLVLTSYHGGETRSHPSYIYWNSKGGFDPENVTMIPTNSASGTLVADFNLDGRQDIFFANHSKDGNHRNDSWLYWGGADGFSVERRTSLPGIGPHLLTVSDIGHVFDRSDHYVYTSPVHHSGSSVRVRDLNWDTETPFKTKVRFQLRAASTKEGLESASWMGPAGDDSFFTKSGEKIEGEIVGSWFQIRAEMISPNSANSPIIKKISLHYQASGNL